MSSPIGVTENVLERALDADILCARSPITIASSTSKSVLMLGKRDLDRAFVRQERSRRLEPDQRRAERRPLHLRDVIGVIQANRDELARRDRQVDSQIAGAGSRRR